MKKLGLFLICILFTSMLYAENIIKKGDHIIFKDQKSGKDQIAEVVRSIDNDTIEVSYQIFLESTNYFEKRVFKNSEIIKSVNSNGTLTPGMNICFKKDSNGMDRGDSAKLMHLFENGTAEVSVGDFFGFRFLIFVRPLLVSQEDIGPCACKECDN